MNDTHDADPSVTDTPGRHWTDLRRSDDTLVGGVGRGVAEYFGIDPVLTRVAFIATSLVGLSGLVAYLGLWLFLPTTDGRPSLAARWLSLGDNELTTRRVGLIATGLVTLLAFGGGVSTPWHAFGWFVWIAVPAAALWWLIVILPRNQAARTASEAAPRTTPQTTAEAPTAPGSGSIPATVALPAGESTTAAAPTETGARGGAEGGGAGPTPTQPVCDEPSARPAGDPRLTLVTLSLAAIACGALGLWQIGGGSVETAAYPAMTLGIIGLGLLIGSVVGDGRALIGWGFLTTIVLLVTAVAPWEGMGQINERPGMPQDLRSSYSLSAGEIRLDLTEFQPRQLHGRSIEIDNRMGRVEIVVPRGTDVHFTGRVRAGDISAFGRSNSGLQVDLSTHDREPRVLRLDVEVGLGQIEVRNP